MTQSDRFKHEYHKFADDQVRDRELGEALGRLRMAVFVAALGPGACIVFNTIKFDPPNLLRYGILATMPLALFLLIVNFVRLPAKSKGSVTAVIIILITLLAVGATYPLAAHFSLTPR